VLPFRQEARERIRRHRLNFLAQGRERPAAQPPQHLDRAPFAAARARAELPVDHALVGGEPLERVEHDRRAEAEAGCDILHRERTVRAGVSPDEVAHRVVDRLDERGRHPDGQRHAERIAEPRGVLDHGPLLCAADGGADGAVRRPKLVE
jgi:hypothetical protein